MINNFLLKITAIEHASDSDGCRQGEDILTIICDILSTPTPTQTLTSTQTPTVTSTNTLTPSVTSTNTGTPVNTPTNTETPTVTPTVTQTPTVTPTQTSTPPANIVLRASNNWTYNLSNNTVLKFNPLNSSYNNVIITLFLSNLTLIPNNALPSLTNISFGTINFGQLIYNGPIFENKSIILTTGSAQYLGNITSQNTEVS